MNTLLVLTGLLGVALVVATAAGGYFAFKVSKNSQLITIYQGTANAWQQRAAAYEDQIKALQTQDQAKTLQIADQDKKIADLNGQVTMLKEMATGSQILGQLVAKVDHITTLLEVQPRA